MAQTITPQIVNLTAVLTVAPTPSQLQQSGPFVSVGGTTLAPGKYQFNAQLSDLEAILQPSETGNSDELQTMGNTFYAQGTSVGAYVLELGAQENSVAAIEALDAWITNNPGVFYGYLLPAAWDNQDEVVGSVIITTGGSGYTAAPSVTFSAPAANTTAIATAEVAAGAVTGVTITDPGSGYTVAPVVAFAAPEGGGTAASGTAMIEGGAVTGVTITDPGSGYTDAPAVTFAAPPVVGTTATGTAVVQDGAVTGVTITNPGEGYTAAPTVTFSAPGGSGTTATGTANLASELDIVASKYASPTGKTYFFVTTTVDNVGIYQPNKSVCAFVPSPLATSQEFGAAAYFYNWLVNNPGANNRLAPMSYRYVYGVTAWPASGYAAQVQKVLSAYGNIFYPCSEAGISNVGQWKGTFSDGSQMSWWYGIDWFQIRSKRDLAAEVINGSNENPPLLYDQDGINQLVGVAQRDLNTAIAYGCALSGSVSATSFADYTAANPNDYKAGIYGGLAATVVGQNGFLTINFFMDAVEFAS